MSRPGRRVSQKRTKKGKKTRSFPSPTPRDPPRRKTFSFLLSPCLPLSFPARPLPPQKEILSPRLSPVFTRFLRLSLSLCLVHIRGGGIRTQKQKQIEKASSPPFVLRAPLSFSRVLSLSLSLSRLSLHLHLLPSPPNLPLLPLLYPCPPLPLFPLPPRFLAHNLRREKKKPSLPTR